MSPPHGAAAASGPPPDAAVDVVVVGYRRRRLLLGCCASIREAGVPVHLIVVDNDSDDGSAAAVREHHPEATVLQMGRNAGFAAAVNRGVDQGAAPAVLLINSDARLRPGALEALLEVLDADDVAGVGPRIVGPDGQVELSFGRTMSPLNSLCFQLLAALHGDGQGPAAGWVDARHRRRRDTVSLTAACLLLRREALEEVGGMDERFFLYAEDVDLCLRLRDAGWRLVFEPRAVVEHERGASGADRPLAVGLHYRRSQVLFYRKHHGPLATGLLRAYLVGRFLLARVLARGPRRRAAATMLRWALTEAGADRDGPS